MTPQEIAGQALELLERDGWCKDALMQNLPWLPYPVGSRCVVGAAVAWGADDRQHAGLTGSELSEFTDAFAAKAREQFPERMNSWSGTVFFNNHPDTTFEDVVLVLEKVIAG